MVFDVISTIPESLESYLGASILARARKKKLIKVNLINLRDFADVVLRPNQDLAAPQPARGDRKLSRLTVDDRPYGGGPGMVLKFQPIAKAVAFAKLKAKSKKLKTRTILFSTRGKKFTSKEARRFAKYDELILICGRYEGVDERVAKHIADEEISIGDYILEGGELPALVLIDAVSRHIPGVLGKHESLEEIKGSYPVYTRPEVVEFKSKKLKVRKLKVPKVLLSGDHKAIELWRKKKYY